MSTEIGKLAEAAAAEFLRLDYGLKIMHMNWRTRFCEIDIVAETKKGRFNRSKTIHFIEVKYRRNNLQGDGLDYITDKKLKQMQLAAEIWVNENNWIHDYQLDAIAVSGREANWEFDYRPNVTG